MSTRPDSSSACPAADVALVPPARSLQSESRRSLLALAGATALAPWLSACGGGSGDFNLPITPPASKDAATIEWGRAAITQALKQSGTPAVSVAMYREGQVVWQEAFGVLDSGTQAPATTQTRFNIGSVSKVFAALATMILVDRKQVVLDERLVKYLPEFRMLSPEFRQITVRHLLSHSSGLAGTYFRNLFTFAPLPNYSAEAEAAIANQHLKHTPGELAVYCNDGFTMIERLVLALTGMDYPSFVQANILDPLEMTHSSYALQPLAEDSVAHGDANGRSQGQEYVLAMATGGLRSTPGDMMKFAEMFINGGMYRGKRIVSAASVAEMGRDQTQGLSNNPSPEWRWGLGWDSVRQLGLDTVGVLAWQKNGGTSFFGSDFFVLPQQRIAVMITGSSLAYGAGTLAEGIALRALQGSGHIRAVPQPLSHQPPAIVAVPRADVQATLGIYGSYQAPVHVRSGDGQSVDLWHWTRGDDKAFQWTQLCLGLRLRADGWWWSDAQPAMSYQWKMEQGIRYLMVRRASGEGHYRLTMPMAQQMPQAQASLPNAWKARLGRTWELDSDDPSSTALINGPIRSRLTEMPELPGYLLWDDAQFMLPVSPERTGMTVKVPVNNGRDLVELVVMQRDSQEWLDVGGSIYRPVATT